ncbi:hypothetical protein N7495_002220 [Penicillium taxi]|uniref:uncharacterized protein n=1 Tax=Penicillium taxi TaxID=168475 RepID=UPI0025450766|nr:uncharacterized protein N7495_002220 [Penicillium taxi]KAJ5901692.1 hypothetical protein N7495_002220 [Penicillium taxi]
MSSKDRGPPKKQDSRLGTRKVSQLSAEQLERKRANDREAQRSIRQRTKGRIEQLENEVSALQIQIAEMRPRSDRYDDLLQQNNILEDEVGHLKRQLATVTGRAEFADSDESAGSYQGQWQAEERPSHVTNMGPSTTAMLSPHIGSPHPSLTVPGASSAAPPSNQPSHTQEWQRYATRSPHLNEAADPEFSNSMYPYSMGGQMHQSSDLRVAGPPLAFGTGSVDQSANQFPSPHRSIPIAIPGGISDQPGRSQPYQQPGPPFQEPSSQTDPAYPYQWPSH